MVQPGGFERCGDWTKSEPEDVYAWNSLGDAYFFLSRYNDAIEAYHEALHIDPQSADACFYLGNAYRNLNRDNDAIDAYRQTMSIDKQHVTVVNALHGIWSCYSIY